MTAEKLSGDKVVQFMRKRNNRLKSAETTGGSRKERIRV
jgi:hypothetical protein